MNETQIDELTPQLLRQAWFIDAVTGHEAARVWDSKRLLPFVAPTHPGTQVKTLSVRVASLDEVGLRPLLAKIEQLDGRRRLVAPGR